MSGPIADRLLHQAFGRGRGADARRPWDTAAWARWSCSGASGTALTERGAALLSGTARAAVGTGAMLGPAARADEHAGRRALHRRPVAAAADAWSGYVPVGRGWMSLAVGEREERDLVDRCVRTTAGCSLAELGQTGGGPVAEDVARSLQEWGVAAHVAAGGEVDEPVEAGGDAPASDLDALLASSGFTASDALAGAVVIDCGQLVSTPWACALLAAWGATVVAVAPPERAMSRAYGPDPVELDLRQAEDRRELERLCARADVLVDNFRHRVWPNLGLDPLALGVPLHVRVPAFPAQHPDHELKAYGFQLEARYGVGHAPAPGRRGPVKAPVNALMDHAAGFAAAVACAGALVARRRGPIEVSHLGLVDLARDVTARTAVPA